MNDFIFFDDMLRDRFASFIAQYGLVASIRPDQMEGFIVEVPDDLDDDIDEAIWAEYATLMEVQRDLIEAAGDEGDRAVMAVSIALSDGQLRSVRIPASIGRRLFEHFTPDEIHELVSAIGDSVYNPTDGPLCRKV